MFGLFFFLNCSLEQFLKTEKTTKNCYPKTLLYSLNLMFFFLCFSGKRKLKTKQVFHIFLNLFIFKNIKQFKKKQNKYIFRFLKFTFQKFF